MSLNANTLAIILVMTLAAAVCRLAGYSLMRFVPLTPRVDAGLRALPLAVMIGIIGPPVLRGGLPEVLGLTATVLAARLGLNDLVALIAGVGTVAALRAVM
jgi:uncharacterized membrane protein